jgi:DNA-binding MarR family transcriptional regulator
VSGKLSVEINQSKPFGLVEEEAALNVMRTAEVMGQWKNAFFKDFGLSHTQYNVLRILRGAGGEGLPCSQLGERMITKDPDVTRLLDRMEARELVLRERSSEDRRVVVTKISRKGLKLLDEIAQPLQAQLKSTLGTISKTKLLDLIELLERVRETLS